MKTKEIDDAKENIELTREDDNDATVEEEQAAPALDEEDFAVEDVGQAASALDEEDFAVGNVGQVSSALDEEDFAIGEVEQAAPAFDKQGIATDLSTIENMIAVNRADCSGCEACANICPKNAIKMIRDAEGFAYPQINHDACIKCGRCNKICPALNFKPRVAYSFPLTLAAIHPNEKILRQSSSGGAFTALSEFILSKGGVVFGASFDKKWRVSHVAVEELAQLKNLRGTKYVQSKIGDVYKQVKKALATSLVLFSGTPCQCAGLKHFLGGDSDRLLTVEVICHGVPSPALWESYIDRLGYAHEITDINFRSKRFSWGQRMDINFLDQEHKTSLMDNNVYGRLFQRNFSLRPSCSACKFKFPNGQADLTLGDAWGVKDFAPEMYDNRGVSLIFVHTQKGANVLERTNLKLQTVNFSDAVKKNPFFISSAIADSRREKFFATLAESDDWYAVMRKYFDYRIQNEMLKKNEAAFEETFDQITAQVRQQFAKNILVVFKPAHNSDRKNLETFFERSFKNCGVYLLEPGKNSTLLCTENFSHITSELKDTAELSNFVKQRNVTEIFVKLPLEFGDSSPAITDWLNNCGLPAKTFAQK